MGAGVRWGKADRATDGAQAEQRASEGSPRRAHDRLDIGESSRVSYSLDLEHQAEGMANV